MEGKMDTGEKKAGVLIFILTVPFCLYNMASRFYYFFTHERFYDMVWTGGSQRLKTLDILLWDLFIGKPELFFFLIGISVLPFFMKRKFLLVSLGMMFLSYAWSFYSYLRSYLRDLARYPGRLKQQDILSAIGSLYYQIICFLLVILIGCFILYYSIKKIRAILPALALVISFVANITLLVLPYPLPENSHPEGFITALAIIFALKEVFYIHLIFLLLLVFIKPYFREKNPEEVLSENSVPLKTTVTHID